MKAKKEVLRPMMIRVAMKHRQLIKEGAKKFNISEAEYVRRCIEFPPENI